MQVIFQADSNDTESETSILEFIIIICFGCFCSMIEKQSFPRTFTVLSDFNRIEK